MKTTTILLTAGDIIERYRLSYQTLNYYTNLGLLRVAKRDGHQRLYDGRDVQRNLQAVARLKDEGYPLRLISRMLTQGLSALKVSVG
ncbi:MAG: MerR family transcriptional regulator [Candidatus Omnitrophica bacterium]|nr:MerR family transcriptional regulator [Candidatus Omnitrophota bacterium]